MANRRFSPVSHKKLQSYHGRPVCFVWTGHFCFGENSTFLSSPLTSQAIQLALFLGFNQSYSEMRIFVRNQGMRKKYKKIFRRPS